jgi:hypothetical protein
MAPGIDFTAHPDTPAFKDMGILMRIAPSTSGLMKAFSATC